MQDKKIFEGRTTNEAIEKGLNELKVSKDKVEIKILENEEKRSFFNILTPRVVKVEMILKESAETSKNNDKITEKIVTEKDLHIAIENIKNFLKEFLKEIGANNVKYDMLEENGGIRVVLTGKEVSHLIGYRGEVLNSLQVIISSVASKGLNEKVKVLVDIDGYRGKREKTLEDLAEKIAKTVIKYGKPITLEPMSSYERKIIHSKLQNNKKVKTTSKGEEPHRKVVISLK